MFVFAVVLIWPASAMESYQEGSAMVVPNGAVILQIESLMSSDEFWYSGEYLCWERRQSRPCHIHWDKIGINQLWNADLKENGVRAVMPFLPKQPMTSLGSNLTSVQFATVAFFYKVMNSQSSMAFILKAFLMGLRTGLASLWHRMRQSSWNKVRLSIWSCGFQRDWLEPRHLAIADECKWGHRVCEKWCCFLDQRHQRITICFPCPRGFCILWRFWIHHANWVGNQYLGWHDKDSSNQSFEIFDWCTSLSSQITIHCGWTCLLGIQPDMHGQVCNFSEIWFPQQAICLAAIS